MKLRKGMPLATKNGQALTNAVVLDVIEGEHQNAVTILSDFGSTLRFQSEEDVLEKYDIMESYIDMQFMTDDFGVEQEVFDSMFCLKSRLQYQIELLTEALEGLE